MANFLDSVLYTKPPVIDTDLPNINSNYFKSNIEKKTMLLNSDIYDDIQLFRDVDKQYYTLFMIYNLYKIQYKMIHNTTPHMDIKIIRNQHKILMCSKEINLFDNTSNLTEILQCLLKYGLYTQRKHTSSITVGRIDSYDHHELSDLLEILSPCYAIIKILQIDINSKLTQNNIIQHNLMDKFSNSYGFCEILILSKFYLNDYHYFKILINDVIIIVSQEWLFYRLCDVYSILFKEIVSDDITNSFKPNAWMYYNEQTLKYTIKLLELDKKYRLL